MLVFPNLDPWANDRELLGDAIHPSELPDACTFEHAVFLWYFHISKMLEPKSIAEIGVRRGYSGKAMMLGSRAKLYHGFDNQSYNQDSIAWAKEHSGLPIVDLCDSQKLTELPGGPYDLIHVDGDHSAQSCLHDCQISWKALNSGGWLLVDDIAGLPVSIAMQDFCAEVRVVPQWVPSYKPMLLLKKEE